VPADEKQGWSWSGLAAVIGAIAALTAAGAGVYAAVSGDDGDSSPSRPPSAAPEATLGDWRREAAKVCSRARDRAAQINQASGQGAPDTATAIGHLEQLASLARSFSDEIAEIPAPPEHEPVIQELSAVLDLEATRFGDAARAARNRDAASFDQAVAKGQELDNREDVLWAKLDARGCSTAAG
jgi:hypothetical protein